MTPTTPCPDSLVVRRRNEPLTASERERLDAHLRSCEDCRVALMVGQDFDRAVVSQRGDADLFARMAHAAVAASPARSEAQPPANAAQEPASRSNASPSPTPSRRAASRRTRWLLLAAALSTVSIATATAWQVFRGRTERARAAAQTINLSHRTLRSVASAPQSAPVAPVAPVAPAALVAPVAPVAPVAAIAVASPTNSTPPHHRPTSSGESEADAPTLFARANASRRSGDVGAASSGYGALQRAHPTSTEAVVSRVLLGRLLLERRQQPEAALSQFDRYLSQRAHTSLTEEALYGRGRALMQLRRAAAERDTWRTLLERYPSSVYAITARQRLSSTE